jgi:intracellular multiplication protein IcmK
MTNMMFLRLILPVLLVALSPAQALPAFAQSSAAELTDEMIPAAPASARRPSLPLPPPPPPPPLAVAAEESRLPDPIPLPAPGSPLIAIGPATALPDRAAEDEAFRTLLRSLAPMDEAQLRTLRRLLDRQALVLAEPPSGIAPRPMTRAVSLSLRPGEEIPRLRLFPGNATSITFSDVTGAPWPIQSVTVGNPQAFAASEAGERGRTNMLVVSPLTQRIIANNIVVALAGHPAPVVIGIEAGGEEVDFRVDMTIRARGPNAAPQIVQTSAISPTNDRIVQAFLDGVPPREAVSLRTNNRDVEVWRLSGRMYVRAPFEMMSPAYEARARNVSGTNVFTLGETPVLLMSENGRMFQVMVRDAGNGVVPASQPARPAGQVQRVIQEGGAPAASAAQVPASQENSR